MKAESWKIDFVCFLSVRVWMISLTRDLIGFCDFFLNYPTTYLDFEGSFQKLSFYVLEFKLNNGLL